MQDVLINTEIIKFDSFLKWAGIVSLGSEAKKVIQDGKVKLNGNIEVQRGKKLKKGDIVEYNEKSYRII